MTFGRGPLTRRHLKVVVLLLILMGPWSPRALAKCDFLFEEFQICAEIQWPDPPLTFVENHFTLKFFGLDGEKPPPEPLPKIEITLYNYYETRWATPPDIEVGESPHVRFVKNIYFDKPGFWQLFIHLFDGTRTSKHHIKIQLEDYE